MEITSIIRIFYIIYSIYTIFIVSISDYNPLYAIVGLLTVWMIYLAFYVGYKTHKKNNNNNKEIKDSYFFSNISNWKSFQYLCFSIIVWVSSILAAKFYTGRGILEVINGLMFGDSSYSIYQKYMIEQNIGQFSMSKIPYIIMLAFLTISAFWTITGILISNKKIKFNQIIFLFSVLAAYIYFGIARGTNFEIYTIFVLIAYSLLSKKNLNKRIPLKTMIWIAILGIILIFVFRMVISARGNEFNYKIHTEVIYQPDRLMSDMFPFLSNIAASLFGYLGFGIYTIGVITYNVFFENLSHLLLTIIPKGFELITAVPLEDIVRTEVAVGVGWVPDYLTFVGLLGIPITLTFIFLLGRLSSSLYYSRRADLLKSLLIAMIFFEMLSFPVGNFILTSTPNRLTLLFILIWYIKGYLIPKEIRKYNYEQSIV